MFQIIRDFYENFIFFYGITLFLSYVFLCFCSYFAIRRYQRYNIEFEDDYIMASPYTPGISVIAPAFNEGVTIVSNIRSLLTLNYPTFEVIIINDGSTDNTLEIMISEFDLVETPYLYIEKIKTKPYKRVFKSTNPAYSILTVVDKENGKSKADASNAGINASSFPYYLSTDVDCILDKNTLLKMIKPILSSTENVIAVGASLRMSNSCDVVNGVMTRVRPPRGILARFQELEYTRSYLIGKMGWSLVNSVSNVSGGLGLFNKDIAVKGGGYDPYSHAEDMDLMTRMGSYMFNNKLKYRVAYIPLSCCWTEGPPNLQIFNRQRTRWGRGLLQLFYIHRKILFNPKYKRLGLVVFPYVFIFELIAPIIEFSGILFFIFLIVTNQVNWEKFIILVGFTYIAAIMISFLTVLWDQLVFKYYKTWYEVIKLLLMAFLEPILYHPLIVFFALKGYYSYLTQKQHEWGSMVRQGFDTKKQTQQA